MMKNYSTNSYFHKHLILIGMCSTIIFYWYTQRIRRLKEVVVRKRKLAERLRAELKLLMARVCAHLMSGARGDTGGAGGGSSDGGARSECPARDRMYACVLQARTALEATNPNSGAASSSFTSDFKKTPASVSEQTRDQPYAAQQL